MNRNERFLATSGKGVADFTPCIRFLESVCDKQIIPMFEQFLRDNKHLCGRCALRRDFFPPGIELEFRKVTPNKDVPATLDQTDMNAILGLLIRLVSPELRRNLVLGPTLSSLYRSVFTIQIRNYQPYMPKQGEMDIFGVFGGGASPPDYTRGFDRPKYPWEPPWPPKDLQTKFDVDALDALPSQKGRSWKKKKVSHWFSETVFAPKVIFSDKDPGEETMEPEQLEFLWQK